MIDSTPSKEIAIVTDLEKQRKSLVERMDKDFGYFRGDLFEMPKSEGEWETITSNRAQRDGWLIINYLANSTKYLFCEGKGDLKDRKKLNHNELVVNGLLFSAERMRSGLPESPFLQAEMAFYRVVRGWGSQRLLVMEDNDGNPYLDFAIWDTRNVNYISGRNGLLKVYYKRMVQKAQAVDEYPGFNFEAGENGLVELLNIWDCIAHRGRSKATTTKITKEAVIACGKEYVKDPEDVKVGGQTIDWLPIRIKAGGGIPFVMDGNSDNIKKVGESYLVNNRNMLDAESKAMTYHLSAAGEESGAAILMKYDSLKGAMPPTWEPGMRNPRGKKMAFPIDVGKGQDVAVLETQLSGRRVEMSRAMVESQLDAGGLNPLAFGVGSSGETAFGVDVRNRNTKEQISPFRLGMQEDFVWAAHEILKQYKLGSFTDGVDMSGFDSKGKWKSEKIDISKIDDKKIFRCSLVVDELRDRAAHASMAIQEERLLPLRERLEIHQLSDDPDASIDAMAQEQADLALDTPLVKGLLVKIKDYLSSPDWAKVAELEHAARKLMMLKAQDAQNMQALSGRQPQVPGGAANPAVVSRRVTAGRGQPPVPRGA